MITFLMDMIENPDLNLWRCDLNLIRNHQAKAPLKKKLATPPPQISYFPAVTLMHEYTKKINMARSRENTSGIRAWWAIYLSARFDSRLSELVRWNVLYIPKYACMPYLNKKATTIVAE